MDREGYLPILAWLPAIAFLSGLVFTLWPGNLHARAAVLSRDEKPQTYWMGVAFMVVCLAITIYGAATAFPSK